MAIPIPIGLENLAKARTFAQQQAEVMAQQQAAARANVLAQQQQQQGQPGGMLGQGFGPLALNVGMGILANNVPRPYTQGPPSLGAGIARGIQQHLAQQQAQQARQLEEARYQTEQQQVQEAKQLEQTRYETEQQQAEEARQLDETRYQTEQGFKKRQEEEGTTTARNIKSWQDAAKALRTARLNGASREVIEELEQTVQAWKNKLDPNSSSKTSTRVSGYSHNGLPVFRSNATGEYFSAGVRINPQTMKKVPADVEETTQQKNLSNRRDAEKTLINAKLSGNQEEIDAAQQDLDYWTEVTSSNVSLYGGGGKTERERALTALSRFVGKIGNGESLTPKERRAAEAGIRQVTNPRIVELAGGGYEQVYDPIPPYVAKLAERLNIDIGRGEKKDDSGTGTTVRTLPRRDPPPLTMPQLTSIAELDQSLDLLNRVKDAATISTVGSIGFFKRGTEVLAGLTDEDANIDATEFKDLVKVIQAKNWREMVGAGQISRSDYKFLEDIFGGTGLFDTVASVKSAYTRLINLVEIQKRTELYPNTLTDDKGVSFGIIGYLGGDNYRVINYKTGKTGKLEKSDGR